jgi:hypothetical protein
MKSRFSLLAVTLVATVLAPALLVAQGTPADYERANSLRAKDEELP